MKKTMITGAFLVLMSTIVAGQHWKTDFEKAKTEAASKELPIVLVFQGSDWCAPCIKLDREIWSTDEFKSYAEKKYIMLQADFPRKKQNKLPKSLSEQNEKLAEKYNTEGYFPLVVVLDAQGKVLGKTGYKKLSVSEYVKLLDSFLKS